MDLNNFYERVAREFEYNIPISSLLGQNLKDNHLNDVRHHQDDLNANLGGLNAK